MRRRISDNVLKLGDEFVGTIVRVAIMRVIDCSSRAIHANEQLDIAALRE
jgi:hypothetical protein